MVRKLNPSDVQVIHSLLQSARVVFDIGVRGRFYELSELESFVADPSWIALAAETDGVLAGFLMCKQMTHHWALLDAFYVLPECRGQGLGRALLSELQAELRGRGIGYLSLVALIGSNEVQSRLLNLGFEAQKTYVWMDKVLEE